MAQDFSPACAERDTPSVHHAPSVSRRAAYVTQDAKGTKNRKSTKHTNIRNTIRKSRQSPVGSRKRTLHNHSKNFERLEQFEKPCHQVYLTSRDKGSTI